VNYNFTGLKYSHCFTAIQNVNVLKIVYLLAMTVFSLAVLENLSKQKNTVSEIVCPFSNNFYSTT
jgi:hypothetical protein